ncbi:MAG: hypothetical protein IJM30_11410 [Thermoguttaceae bacterium]|nr:hypothetical protein [Thermoguttaceae bacterium]
MTNEQIDDRPDAPILPARPLSLAGALATLLEVALIFGVFAAYGSWPVPDVNEQYYVGKAIHFWNPDWLKEDPFLNTPDSHWLFYAVFGLLSFAFRQNALVWVGRCLVWLATAAAWVRLSRSLLRSRWVGALTAAAFAFCLESFHLAGEWIIGGIEGKALSFPFVFWGLACFIEGKYNRAWILYGIGSAFHVLVGGWVVLASLVVWFFDSLRKPIPTPEAPKKVSRFSALFRNALKTLPGLLVGGAISLLGLVPALRLDAGATPAEILASRKIYVFERLSHHLVASSLPWTFLVRFGGLVALFALAWIIAASLGELATPNSVPSEGLETSDAPSRRRFRANLFVCVALLFALVGATVDWGSIYLEKIGRIDDRKLFAAGILRYYWYRLSDWAVPFGLVFALGRCADELIALARAKFDRARASGWFGACLGWLALGFGAHFAARFWFERTARKIALSSAVGGLVPLPKPTEAPSFAVALAAVGILLAILALGFALVARARKRGNAPTWLVSGLAVWTCVLFVAAPGWRLAKFVDLRGTKVIPRSAPPKESIADGWLDVCHWARDNTPENAIFLAPRGCDSFKWEARRAEVGSWKEIPQDAKSIVAWHKKMERFYANPGEDPDSSTRWNQPLVGIFINKGRGKILKEAKEFGYQYAIVETPPYLVATIPEALKRWKEFEENDIVYKNEQFVVLKLDD